MSDTIADHSTLNGTLSSPLGTYVSPTEITAEQATLGSVMIEAAAIDKALAILSRQDFWREEHTLLFGVLVDMRERGLPIDSLTILHELETRGLIEKVGGKNYIMALFDAVPTAANVEFYAKIVQEAATLRRLTEAALEIVGLARGPVEDLSAVLSRAGELVGEVTDSADSRREKSSLVDMHDVWAQDVKEPPRIWGDFIYEGACTMIAAPSNQGKTTLVYNLITHLAEGRDLYDIPIIRPFRVLFGDEETPEWLQSMKLRDLYGDAPPVKDMVFFKKGLQLPRDQGRLLRDCKRLKIDLVVLDTVSSCMNLKNENDNSEVSQAVNSIVRPLSNAGVATLLLHHTGKIGTGPRGASAWKAHVDILLNMDIHKGTRDDDDYILVLKKDKARKNDKGNLYLQRTGNDQFRRLTEEEAGKPTPGDDEPTPTAKIACAQTIVGFLESRPRNHANFGEIIAAVKSQSFTESTGKRAMSKLEEEGTILRAVGGGYVLADPFADG